MNHRTNPARIGRLMAGATVILATLGACSSGSDPESFGHVMLPLSSSAQGTDYRLTDATFEVEGVEAATLSSNDTDATLDAELPVGDYSVELQPGWRLLDESSGEEPLEVDATLLSDNPQAFFIEAETTTRVTFLFQTREGSVGFGDGVVELAIDVEKLVSEQIVFSEVMPNPTALPDADGEWLELTNTGTDAMQLEGCEVLRDATGFTIDAPLSVEPGQSVALANSEAPGFAPDYVYSGLSLPNSAAFVLELLCSTTLDSVTIDPSLMPNATGNSLSLDPAFASPNENDSPEAWCAGTDDYNQGDLGTPGEANPNCP